MWVYFYTRIPLFKHKFRRLLKYHPLRFIMMGIIFLLMVWGLYFLIMEGLKFLNSLGGLGTVVVERLFYIFFMSIFFMLIISTSILFYVCLFRSEETKFLLVLPLEIEEVIFTKFLEAGIFSSWASFIVFFSFISAYGTIEKLDLNYYIVSFLFFTPFVFICVIIGSILTFLSLRYLNAQRLKILLSVVVILFSIWWIFRYFTYSSLLQEESEVFLSKFAPFFKISKIYFMPYFWISQGLREFYNKRYIEFLVYLSSMYSTLFMLGIFFRYVFKKLFDYTWQKVLFFKKKTTRVAKFVDSILKVFPSGWFKAFLSKDVKIFLRDPLQWSHFLVFFGILFIYIINLRTFSYHLLNLVWKNLVVFLNTFATCAVLASLGTRFIYPQLSLEGLNYWILGLSPVSLFKILWEKFILSFLFCLFISESLIILSNIMVKSSPLIFYTSCVIVFWATVSITSICIGLGAYFADFTKKHHFEVISEFGGLVALIVSLVYIIGVVFSTGALIHFYIIGKIGSDITTSINVSLGIIGFVSIIISSLCLGMGVRSLKLKEF